MKFAITAASKDDYYMIKEFKTIEELIDFYNESQHSIVIGPNMAYKEQVALVQEYNPKVDAEQLTTVPYAITIYDDYME